MTYNKGMFTSLNQNWKTPNELYNELDKEFKFDLDPCPSENIIKEAMFIKWKGSVFVNPPYNNIENFLNKGLIELKKIIAIQLFIFYHQESRTGTKWFHNYVLKYAKEVRFIRGKLKFSGYKWNAPFYSIIVIFSNKSYNKELKK